MDEALGASAAKTRSGSEGASGLTDLLSKVPGTGLLCRDAVDLQAASDAQALHNQQSSQTAHSAYNTDGVSGAANLAAPSANSDLQAIIAKVYPILEFRDKVVKALNRVVSTIPGLETLIETITEKVTLFVMSILAPYIQPIIEMASEQLKVGSSNVINASGDHQFGPWNDPYCTAPTHSILSKDHFSNMLNEPAGRVAVAILQYVAPRIIYGWDHPDIPVEQMLEDVVRVFHHPALRQPIELHQKMFSVVETWVRALPDQGASLNEKLNSASVHNGGNHTGGTGNPHLHKPAAASGGPGMIPHGNPMNSRGPRGTDFEGHTLPKTDIYQQQTNEPTPADFRPNDPYAFPTAYQQGYEMPDSNGYPQAQAPGSRYAYEQQAPSRDNQRQPSERYDPQPGVSYWQAR